MKFSQVATCFAATAVSTANAFVPATSFHTSSSVNNAQLYSTTASTYADVDRYVSDHPNNNIPPHIAALVGRGLHTKEDHPIGIVRAKIQDYFNSLDEEYKIFDAEDPIVTCTQCFDDLRIEPDHPGRSPSDTYYIDDKTLLRTHTSALLRQATLNVAFVSAARRAQAMDTSGITGAAYGITMQIYSLGVVASLSLPPLPLLSPCNSFRQQQHS